MRNVQTPSVRRAVAGGSTILFAVYYLLGGLRGEIVWTIAVFVQLAIAVWAVLGFQRNRTGWLLIIAGQACFLAGDIGFTVLEYGLESEAFPSIADAFYLLGYVLVAFGLVPIARTNRGRQDLGGLIDATIVTVAVAAIMWVFIVDPLAADSAATLFSRVIAAAYTGGDVLALGMLALILSRRSGHARPFWLTAASVAALFVADAIYAVLSLHGDYELGGPLDGVWWISYTLIVLAVLHPECERLGTGDEARVPRLTNMRLIALATAALAAPTTLIVRIESLSMSQTTVLLSGTIVMFMLVIVRLQLIAGDLDQSRVELSHEATHDSLTGLANRTLLSREIRTTIESLGPDDEIAVLCLDLDDFKPINDLLGHPTGDDLLQVIAGRLATTVRDGDVVARLGGDEFAILLRRGDAAAAISVAERAIAGVSRSADIGGPVEVYPRASVGITVGGADSSEEDLLRDADIAMYAAKRRGKGQWALFEAGIAEHVSDFLELRAELTNAVSDNQLLLHYQPVVRVADRRAVAAEALVRWNHPELGLISPDRFIPVAEDTGLIVPIGAWVLEQACATAVEWSTEPDGPEISVNVSAVQLEEPGFVDLVRTTLEQTGLPGGRLVLELTESAELGDEDAVADAMQRLRDVGVRIALDDLGAGFASLRGLRSLPIDIVKLDRSLMQAVGEDGGLLSGLIGLLLSLDLAPIVEGVETELQERFVCATGARYAQGFLYARPMSKADIGALLSDLDTPLTV